MGHLQGKRVVITRPQQQSANLLAALASRGAQGLVFPTIAIEAVRGDDLHKAQQLMRDLVRGVYDTIVFTSVNSVHFLEQHLHDLRTPFESLNSLTVFAIGAVTASLLAEHGVTCTEAQPSHSTGLLQCMRQTLGDGMQGRSVLLPRARRGNDDFVTTLERECARVAVAILYETVALETGPPLPNDAPIHWLTFTSPSAVRAFVKRAKVPPGARVACIGPTTADAAQALGLSVDVVPQRPSVDDLVRSMDEHA
ncbi:MAG: uroporphyrinogen-III synthase [Myxococcota bacterium]